MVLGVWICLHCEDFLSLFGASIPDNFSCEEKVKIFDKAFCVAMPESLKRETLRFTKQFDFLKIHIVCLSRSCQKAGQLIVLVETSLKTGESQRQTSGVLKFFTSMQGSQSAKPHEGGNYKEASPMIRFVLTSRNWEMQRCTLLFDTFWWFLRCFFLVFCSFNFDSGCLDIFSIKALLIT